MTHSFEYMHVITALDSITVAEIGECCLHAFNDYSSEYYILVTTTAGITRILTIGPIKEKIDEIDISKRMFQYNEAKIIKFIEKWLQDTKKEITQVFECEKEEIFDIIKNINILEHL